MSEQVSYFEVASYLAEIEGEYREMADEVERISALVGRLQEKWPGLSTEQAVAYIRVFTATD